MMVWKVSSINGAARSPQNCAGNYATWGEDHESRRREQAKIWLRIVPEH